MPGCIIGCVGKQRSGKTLISYEISPAEAVDKLRHGTEFDFLGYDFIKNQMVFRECEPENESE